MAQSTILEFDDEGIHERAREDLEMVERHRRFLEGPERYPRNSAS